MKKNPEFDETMGSYDRIEFCKLVRLYLLDFLTKKFGKQNIHLYRDNGFENSYFKSCFENISGLESQKIKKKNLQKQWIKHNSRV